MEDKSILEELCDMVFENAQPQTESYKQMRLRRGKDFIKPLRTNKSSCLKNATTH